jgi:hypothetical protein
LFIRACFIQGLHDDRIKTIVEAKGNVNTPMAELVDVALEEESTMRGLRETFLRKGNLGTRELDIQRGNQISTKKSV